MLYPWDDYPFDIEAVPDSGPNIKVTVARDPSDATLWRGMTSLPRPGTWTVRVRNFPSGTEGVSATVVVTPGSARSQAGELASVVPAALGLVVGSLAGLIVGRRTARR